MKKNNYKIKRYGTNMYESKRQKKHNILWAISRLLIIAVLVFIGFAVYEPVYEFIIKLPDLTKPAVSSSLPNSTSSENNYTSSSVALSSIAKEEPLKPDELAVIPIEMLKSPELLDDFILSLTKQGIGQAIITVKDKVGNVNYQSTLETATSIKAILPNAVTKDELESAVNKLLEKNIIPIASIGVFNDHIFANSKRSSAVHYLGQSFIWLDNSRENGGRPWVNPYATSAWTYFSDMSKEVLDLGFKKLILEGMTFPKGFALDQTNYGNIGSITKQQILVQFLDHMKTMTEIDKNDIFVLMLAEDVFSNDKYQYGGNSLDLILQGGYSAVIDLSPNQFEQKYSSDRLNITNGATPIEKVTSTAEALNILLSEYPIDLSGRVYGAISTTSLTPKQLVEQKQVLDFAGFGERIALLE